MALALGWAGVLWWLSSLSGDRPPGFVSQLGPLGNFMHAPAFGLLALFVVLAAPRRGGRLHLPPRSAWVAFGLVLSYAFLDEWHQKSVPGRVSSLFDVLTDAVGGASVIWIVTTVLQADTTGTVLARRFLLALLGCLLAGLLATTGLPLT